uniref:FERM domain-containing protein n=1 Tax=Strigamia maritima TaxID=126957 RepID=T1IUU4_STRMM
MGCLGDTNKFVDCKIILLDGTELNQSVKAEAAAQRLLDGVFQHLNIIETIYFGLRYLDDSNQSHWLEAEKKICKQLRKNLFFTLYFSVKFYASDPCKLAEEITRYQFFLQLKQDILQARLPVSFEVGTELSAYIIQSELGDYDPRRHLYGYVSEFHFLPAQTMEMENKISEIHKTLIGQIPSAAELNFLEKAKWLDMYGVDLHPVLGEDNMEYFLGLTPCGVIVLRNKTKVGNYFWPRITKVYFKGRYFMIRVKDKNHDENTYGFELPTKQACKHLWKCCVEHHGFFRLAQVNIAPLDGSFRFSTFRSSKRFQNRSEVIARPPQPIQRVPSQRSYRRLPPSDGIDNNQKQPGDPPTTIPSGSNNNTTFKSGDSPRSTRSAPWGSVKLSKGLYSSSANPSPRSVRSKHSVRTRSTHHFSSVESESSCDERSHSSRRRHKSGHGSDSSRTSNRSRKKNRRKDRGSDSEFIVKHRRRHHISATSTESITPQWCEIQEQSVRLHDAVIKNLNSHRSGYMNSGMESETEVNYNQRKKHKRRSLTQSRSSADSYKRFPEELRKHFQYVDSSGFSEDQLKDIPYTKVLTRNSSHSHRSPNTPKSRKGVHGDGSVRSGKNSLSKSSLSVKEPRRSSGFLQEYNASRDEMSTEL